MSTIPNRYRSQLDIKDASLNDEHVRHIESTVLGRWKYVAVLVPSRVARAFDTKSAAESFIVKSVTNGDAELGEVFTTTLVPCTR